jgi:hypothetical protein
MSDACEDGGGSVATTRQYRHMCSQQSGNGIGVLEQDVKGSRAQCCSSVHKLPLSSRLMSGGHPGSPPSVLSTTLGVWTHPSVAEGPQKGEELLFTQCQNTNFQCSLCIYRYWKVSSRPLAYLEALLKPWYETVQ